MKVTLEVKEQNILDTIITAIEGGSNYWYFLSDDAMDTVRLHVPYDECPYISEALGIAVMKGAAVPINDAEDEETVLGILTKESIAEGLQKAGEDGREELSMLLEDEITDANDSDVLFQYFVLGEITFG
jgi:hypothetical protein